MFVLHAGHVHRSITHFMIAYVNSYSLQSVAFCKSVWRQFSLRNSIKVINFTAFLNLFTMHIRRLLWIPRHKGQPTALILLLQVGVHGTTTVHENLDWCEDKWTHRIKASSNLDRMILSDTTWFWVWFLILVLIYWLVMM